MGFFRKLLSKIRASLYVFKKAEIMRNVVNKEIQGEYDNLCHKCYFNERYAQEALQKNLLDPGRLRISLKLGGAMGDYIVYLRFVDEISTICPCDVDLFLDRIEFGRFVYSDRPNVEIIHDAENCLFYNSVNEYDLAIHLDHGFEVRHSNLGAIRVKAPLFYETACAIIETGKKSRTDISKQHEREMVILRQAEYSGQNKWTKFSCGNAVDMSDMYSAVLIDGNYLGVLERYDLSGRRYITVNFGADKNMGGTAQTKVIPQNTLLEFINVFKKKYPDILVVQTGVKDSCKIDGADRYCFDCVLEETSIILKHSLCHVDSEGGLVHLSSQMSTPCVVSFGPTPVYYYGYPRNKNIVSPVCSNCMSVTPQWSIICPKKLQIPECMKAITAEMILEKTEEVISEIKDKNIIVHENMKLDEIFDKLIKEEKAKRIAVICPLTDKTCKAVLKLHKKGNSISLFINTELNDSIVKLRSELRRFGIRTEYGNALNIARKDNSFDFLISFINDEHDAMELCECKRILCDGGQLFIPSDMPSIVADFMESDNNRTICCGSHSEGGVNI